MLVAREKQEGVDMKKPVRVAAGVLLGMIDRYLWAPPTRKRKGCKVFSRQRAPMVNTKEPALALGPARGTFMVLPLKALFTGIYVGCP